MCRPGLSVNQKVLVKFRGRTYQGTIVWVSINQRKVLVNLSTNHNILVPSKKVTLDV